LETTVGRPVLTANQTVHAVRAGPIDADMSEENSMKLREVVQASEARASRLRRSALRSYDVFAPVPNTRDAASRRAAIESATTTTTAATLTTLGVAAASWVVAVRQMNGMDIGVATELGSFAFFVAVWVSMMAAMMLPGPAPAVSRHARASGRVRAVPIFVGSYVAVWTMVGVAVYALYRPHGSSAAGAVAIAAGVYELTPLKQHFRRRCRESVRSELEFGLCCVGSSIGLMAMLVALGVMSVTWMSVIAILVLAQKLLPPRAAIDVLLALAIVALGVLIVLAPSSVAGFTPAMSM
jgi:predicted metal-binding membrane protein